MRFLPIFTTLLAGAAAVDAAISPTVVIGAINGLTTTSDTLRIEVGKITLFNAVTRGPIIARGFIDIIKNIAVAVTLLKQSPPTPFPADEAKLVVAALTTFVKVHQALLNVVIGKHGLLTLVPFFEPIRVALVQLEAIVDSFAFFLIQLIPTEEIAAGKQFGALSVTVKTTIRVYENPFPG